VTATKDPAKAMVEWILVLEDRACSVTLVALDPLPLSADHRKSISSPW